MSKKGTVKPLIGYDPHRNITRANKSKYSEKNPGKVATILQTSWSAQHRYEAVARAEWERLYAAGKATARKANGSYYIIGES